MYARYRLDIQHELYIGGTKIDVLQIRINDHDSGIKKLNDTNTFSTANDHKIQYSQYSLGIYLQLILS